MYFFIVIKLYIVWVVWICLIWLNECSLIKLISQLETEYTSRKNEYGIPKLEISSLKWIKKLYVFYSNNIFELVCISSY